VSVFLRWGIFGILGIAALLYAYNASKRLAEQHAAKAPAQAPGGASAQPASTAPRAAPMAAPSYEGLTPRCRTELEVAYLGVLARDGGDPLDRLLRAQKIAWQDDARFRERLTQVATRWYRHDGAVDPAQMRETVVVDCLNSDPGLKR
jgi:hypothetical protein